MINIFAFFKSRRPCLGAVLLCLVTLAPAHAQRKFNANDYAWESAPWKMRYVVVTSPWLDTQIKNAEEYNKAQHTKNETNERFFESLLDWHFPLKGTPKMNDFISIGRSIMNYKGFGYQVLEFDRTGWITSPNRGAGGLLVRERVGPDLNREVFLVEGDGSPGNDLYRFAEWFKFETFTSSSGEKLSPTLCHFKQGFAENHDRVGCREWIWQLYRPASLIDKSGSLPQHSLNDWQPYINVTTYVPPDKLTLKENPEAQVQTFIGEVLGWARFDDPVRPVIGKHGDYWLCLHECPDGETPGIIPDIQSWATKRGWPMPKPVSLVPDDRYRGSNNYVSGNYIFYGNQPLVVVSGKGSFSSFGIEGHDDYGRLVPDEDLLEEIEKDGFTVSIKRGAIGCSEGLVIEAGTDELLSSKPLSFKNTIFPRASVAALERQGKALLSSVLRSNHVDSKWNAEVLKAATIKPIAILPNKRPSIVITANHELNEKTISVLLIAMPLKNGKYAIKHQSLGIGGPSDNEDFSGSVELVEHVDVDGDNIEELLFNRTAYESFGTVLLHWNGKKWIEVASNGGGC
jgi:hypothetical protein